ncbi:MULTISPECIES: VWA domain-containing protein [unclassified Frigoribacterium]|uniref:vWA domain-containing protein n=1 Tax=unclassified Frigoribacterium TaxID=2627005 RepID=UPI00156390AE|nr:VWA domain-containing protein [Frigoribacterium sp. VKM Ac-2860]NQX07416.1 VWA domain-containing protein [Frigoribacterium sp. VKM Ac-2859]
MARANRRLHRAARYQRYADGPDPLAPPADLSEALDAVGRDVMAGTSAEAALREFLRRGGRDRTGLDDLARQVAERRRALTRDHHLDGTLHEVRELLDRALMAERAQLARDVDLDDGDRALAQLQLDSLPPSPAGAVAELSDYRWQSREARDAYDEIKDLLGREMLDQRFAGMKTALENASDADREAVAEMLRDLDDLLAAHARGDDTPEQFDDFMAKHGASFPEQPGDVDALIDALAARAAAAQRLRNSMTAEQRAELDALAQQAFGSPDLMQSLERLDGTLRALRPGQDWSGSEGMDGEQGLGLGDGTGVFQDLADLDSLAEQLAQQSHGSSLDDVDLDALRRQLGEQAAVDAAALRRLEKALRDSGALRRRADGTLALTPRAMRQLGKDLLRDVAAKMSGRAGRRELRSAGGLGDRSGASREWAFGDTEPWDVTRTITNAVTRTAAGGGRTDGGVRIEIGDVEVHETDTRTQACVALLVDTSFSMAMEDRWVPMKRTALALHTLITSRFRGDDLQLIGFGRHAEVMPIEQLVALDAKWDKGTNLHHALLLANRHFRKHPTAQPVLLIVTDGEPTSHLEPGGEVFFDYPPHPVTILRAVEQLDVARRLGAHTTFFRLGDDPGLARFVDGMARRVDGTVTAPDLDDLGAAVVGSYVRTRATEPPA